MRYHANSLSNNSSLECVDLNWCSHWTRYCQRTCEYQIAEAWWRRTKADGRTWVSVVAEFEKQQDEVNARLDSLFAQREKLIAELGARKLTEKSIESIIEFARNVRAGIEDADFDAKRRVLESLGVQVKVKDGRYFIKCLIAETEGEIRITDKRRKGAAIVSHKSVPDAPH